MRTLVQFLARIEPILYGLAALGIFLSLRGLVLARQQRRIALFPLEREAARNRAQRSLSTILALILVTLGVYIMVNIVAPNVLINVIPPTPTPLIFVTQQATSTPSRLLYPSVTPTQALPPGLGGTSTPTPSGGFNACDIFGAKITSPTPNQVVSGQVAVRGQANIIGFAQYKFELKGPSTNGAWVVVGSSRIPIADGLLGTWDATSLAPGNYVFRLVVSRDDNSFATPCEVPITIAGPAGSGATDTPTPTP